MQRNEIKPLYIIKQYWDCHLKNKIRSIRVIRGEKNNFCTFLYLTFPFGPSTTVLRDFII